MKLNSAALLLTLSAIIWGATAPIMKLALQEIPVFSLAFLRMFFASAILGTLIFKSLKIQKADYKTFLYCALTGVTLNLTFFFFGIKLTQAILAAFLIASIPVFTMIGARIYLKEKPTKRLLFSSLVALLGVVIIVGKFDGELKPLELLGNFLLLISTLVWVAHEIIAKKLLKTYDGSVVAFYSMAIGSATFFPLFVIEFFANPSWYLHMSGKGILGLLYGIFFASLAAYWAWQKGLKMMPAGNAAFFFYLDPVSGAILAMVLLGEKLTPQLVVGGAFIAAAVFLAEQKRKNHPLHKRA